MKVGILGTGMVGRVIAEALINKGHEVMLGTRDVSKTSSSTEKGAFGQDSFSEWSSKNPKIKLGNFADCMSFGEILMNATSGLSSIKALELGKAETVSSKTLIDIANKLDFSKGMPPVALANDTSPSLAEEIQTKYPNLNVVKSLSTMNAFVMVNANLVSGGDSTVFISGNSEKAKDETKIILKEFGWTDIFDLGDIKTSRGIEMLLPFWINVWQKLGNTPFNYKIQR